MRRNALSPLLLALSLALGTSMTAHAQSQPAIAVLLQYHYLSLCCRPNPFR